MAGKFVKGALIEMMQTFIAPIPNVIVFQFNPETMTHTWSQAAAADSGPAAGAAGGPEQNKQGESSSKLAVKGEPGETFSFTLVMDSDDDQASGNPVTGGVAAATGLYTRLAALEMLLYPAPASPASGLVGAVSAAASAVGLSGGASSPSQTVPAGKLPIVLFVWGAGRILPVRVTGLTITEKLYDSILNPTHVEAQIALQVLTPEDLKSENQDALIDIARVAYLYSQGLRQTLATANLANSASSVLGMLPF